MSMNQNRLGDAIYDAMMAVVISQQASESEDLGRARMRAMAGAIIDEIKLADIASLSTTSIPAGTTPHIHSPATIVATGKIS